MITHFPPHRSCDLFSFIFFFLLSVQYTRNSHKDLSALYTTIFYSTNNVSISCTRWYFSISSARGHLRNQIRRPKIDRSNWILCLSRGPSGVQIAEIYQRDTQAFRRWKSVKNVLPESTIVICIFLSLAVIRFLLVKRTIVVVLTVSFREKLERFLQKLHPRHHFGSTIPHEARCLRRIIIIIIISLDHGVDNCF